MRLGTATTHALNRLLTDDPKTESYTSKMAIAEPLAGAPTNRTTPSTELADQWRLLTRAATFVAILTSPALFVWFREYQGWSTLQAIGATVGLVVASRGVIDLFFRRLIPWPSLFGTEAQRLREEDVMARRRVWFWRFWVKAGIWIAIIGGLGTLLVQAMLG